MQLYYVMGGGMGHLSRAAAFFYTYGLNPKGIILFTANPLAKLFFPESLIINPPLELQNNQKQYSLFLKNILETYAIETLYLDTFPLGIFFEIGDMAFVHKKVIYLARLLDWEKYKIQMPSFHFKFYKTYIVEDLQSGHRDFISQHSLSIENANLIYPPKAAIDLKAHFAIQSPIWLIIHSQPLQEVEDLFFYAKEVAKWQQIKPCFLIITKVNVEENIAKEAIIFSTEYAYMYLAQADKIFTGAGFNLLQQCKDFKEKHYVMPFERTWDLQFERAKNYKKR